MKEKSVLFFGKFLRSATRSQNYAEALFFFQGKRSSINAGSRQGFGRRRQGQGQYAGDMFALPLVHPGEFVEVDHFARDLHLNFGRIEARDASNPAFPL